MKDISSALPFWARALLLAGIAGIVLGAGLVAWRLSTGPVTLSLAVGSFDGEGCRMQYTSSNIFVHQAGRWRPAFSHTSDAVCASAAAKGD